MVDLYNFHTSQVTYPIPSYQQVNPDTYMVHPRSLQELVAVLPQGRDFGPESLGLNPLGHGLLLGGIPFGRQQGDCGGVPVLLFEILAALPLIEGPVARTERESRARARV